MNEWKKWEIKTIEKVDFPESLKKIPDCPKKLFYRGVWNEEIFEKTLAIVGSRKITRYGKETIEKFMPEIVSQNITVISGFMYGVDTRAHEECLNFGGKTIAVLGGGLNRLTTSWNDGLYTKILETGGLIISEFEPEFQPTLWSFPQRNRIVSGLSTVGVLIVEAGIKSGSLITAKLALKQKRDVFAVPGQINSSVSEGTNWLIKNKAAKMVMNVGDIFGDNSQSPMQTKMFKDFSDLSTLEKQIIGVVENEAVTIDELCRKIKLPITEISTTISMMLMRDLIVEENGKIYIS